MAHYLKYHVASGHVFARLTVIEASHLDLHRTPGHDFTQVSPEVIDIANIYVATGGAISNRSKVLLAGGTLNSAVGETIEIAGLPADAWIMFGEELIKSSKGKVQLKLTTPGRRHVEVIGKYAGNPFTLVWSDIGDVKEETKAKIDADAEAARSRVITPGSGQAMTYLRKADAARAYLAGLPLSEAQMLRLTSEATRLGGTVDAAAQILVTTADSWETIDAQIDSIRLAKKAAVNTAVTGNEVAKLYKGIVWPV